MKYPESLEEAIKMFGHKTVTAYAKMFSKKKGADIKSAEAAQKVVNEYKPKKRKE